MSAPSLELFPTGPEHAEIIRNLYQFYAYESSDWEQEDVEADGRFYLHEAHMARYWQSPGWGASLVLVDGFIAGFVLVERSELPGVEALELADLFILKRYRRQGIGRAIACQMLCSGAHDWLLRCYRQDEAAMAFCSRVVAELPRAVQAIAPEDDPQLHTWRVAAGRH